MQSRGELGFLLCSLLFCLACKQGEPPVNTSTDMAQYALLPGLKNTHHEQLQEELARLLAEQATPLQLTDGRSVSRLNQPQVEPVPDASSAKSRLDVIFPANFRDSTRERLGKVWPVEGFEFTPATLHVVSTLTDRYRIKREQYEQEVSAVDFLLPVDHSLGLAADTGYLDAIELGHRLEGLYAARLLAGGDPQAAIQPLRLMLRVSELLAQEKSVTSRSAGAVRRNEALQVLEGIARHPAATPSVHRQLEMLLAQQLERWPADADAWIGDRAQGLHTYELVRGGYLLSLLTYDELREFRDEVGVEKLAEVVALNVDQDELFYLRTMRDLVDACRKPHYERDKMFRQIESNLELLRERDSYPFIADQLLLLELQQGSRLMALDRARVEAWALALRIASKKSPLESTINPLTGDQFFIDVTETQIVVDAIDPERGLPAAIVPRLE